MQSESQQVERHPLEAALDAFASSTDYRRERRIIMQSALRKHYCMPYRHLQPWLVASPQVITLPDYRNNTTLCDICRQINFDWLFKFDLAESYRSYKTSMQRQDPFTDTVITSPDDLDVFLPPGDPGRGYTLPPLPLGYFEDLLERRNCEFCSLVTKSILDCLDTNEDSYMHLRIDGYGKFPRIVNHPMTRSFCKLENVKKDTSDLYALRVWISEDHGLFGGVRAFDFQRLSDEHEPWEGRSVNDKINTVTLLTWVAKATLLHKQFIQDNSLLQHFRLVDVKRKCVTRVSEPRRYLALSYVWGQANYLLIMKSTEKELAEPGSLERVCVPRTIADAMEVTARVGIRYLWVDSLCIIQDDDASKAIQIAAMGQIYSCAVATIVAASGSHADSGLPGVQDNTRKSFQFCQHLEDHEIGSCMDNHLKHADAPMRPADPFHFLWGSEYNRRAWTFQEFWLSDTNIIFLDRIALCYHLGNILREDVWEANNMPLFKEANTKTFAQNCDMQLKSLVDVTKETAVVNVQRYGIVLDLYSERKLSSDKDAINAFTAMLDILKPAFRGQYLYGLPSTELEYALLWRPKGSLRQRTCASRRNLTSKQPVFPTWSWAAWDGNVETPDFEKRFSRVLWLDPTDGKWFSSTQYRGYIDTLPEGWIQVEGKGRRYYTELATPHAAFLHPVAEEGSQSRKNMNFLPPDGHVLTFMALTGYLPLLPGRWCMERLKPFNYRHLSPEICSYTLRDLLGPNRVAGVVYLHVEQPPGTAFNRNYELVVISRTTHYDMCSKEKTDPPADDSDLFSGVHRYVWEEEQRNMLNNKAMTDWEKNQIKSQFDLEIHWGIYDVLVVEWVGGIAYRIGVGVCYARAFHFAGPTWKKIVLG